MQLIQIVPRMGPWDGVGDYAAQLGATLRERHGVLSHFIEAGGEQGPAALTAAVAGAGRDDILLLHYVGYGYAKRGVPLWLARICASASRSGLRLGVVFHELYATGRPWQSSFWFSGLQRYVTRSLARECQFALLTREASRKWFERGNALATKPVEVLPIPSSVGEPPTPPLIRDRPPTMVVWGSAHAKGMLYRDHWAGAAKACEKFGIERVVDIGPPASVKPVGVVVEEKGRLPAGELSRILLGARCAVLVYPVSFLAKSTIFAAYAAHGVVPLVVDDAGTVAGDGLTTGKQFLRLSRSGPESCENAVLDDVAQSACIWYSGHSVAAHADALRRLLVDGNRES